MIKPKALVRQITLNIENSFIVKQELGQDYKEQTMKRGQSTMSVTPNNGEVRCVQKVHVLGRRWRLASHGTHSRLHVMRLWSR